MPRAMASAEASRACSWPWRSRLSISRTKRPPAQGRARIDSATSSSLARSDISGPPAVAGAVHGLDLVEGRIQRLELPPDALDVRGDNGVVHHHLRLAHQLLAALDV